MNEFDSAIEILVVRGLHRGDMVNPLTGNEVDHIGALALACGADLVVEPCQLAGVCWRLKMPLPAVDNFSACISLLGSVWFEMYAEDHRCADLGHSLWDLPVLFADDPILGLKDYCEVLEMASKILLMPSEDVSK